MNAKIHLALLTAVLMPLASASATLVRADHLSVELVSESSVLVPGQVAWLGLILRHDPHWHSYWINPGDSGLPTRLNWTLPQGFTADEIAWPAPTRFDVDGLYNFGYADEQLLPVALHIPADAEPGEQATLAVEAKWLVCREACVSGKATLTIELPIATSATPSTEPERALFTAARETTPRRMPWNGRARLAGERIAIRLQGADLPALEGLDVFAVDRRVLGNAPAQLGRNGGSLIIDAAKNDYFDQTPTTLDLVLTQTMTNGHVNAWQVRVPFVADAAGE